MNRTKPTLALARLVFLGLLLTGAAIVMLVTGTDRLGDMLQSAAESRWGVLAFFVVYVTGVVLLLPGTLGSIASGAVFGFGIGFPLALGSATVGATLAFLLSRSLGRDGSRQLLGTHLISIDRWIGTNDFVSILVLRLMPIVPFNGLNYAAGLTGVRLNRYVASTVLGMVPGTALVTFASSRANDPSGNSFLLASAALAATAVVSAIFARRFQNNRTTTRSTADRR